MSARTPGSGTSGPAATSTAPQRRPGSFGRWLRKMGWRHLVALAALAFALFPIVWIISASVNPSSSLQGQELIPEDPTLDNYRSLFDDPNVPYGTWFRNTMVIAGGATIINTLLCAMAAYSFSRLRFRGRRTGLLSILLVQMFPQILAIVALFAIMQNIGRVFPSIGLGSQGGLLLIYLGGALGVNTWLMKGFFDSIPRSLDESAKIDGASHFQIFRIIILPLAAPVLAVVALLTFIMLINDFLIASVMLNDVEDYTLAVGLYRFIDGRYGANWGPFAAGALLAALPVIVLFQFLQRYIVSGLTQGAVKE